MIGYRDLKINARGTLGDYLYLVKVSPSFAYEGGVPTQLVTGFRYSVACAGAGMQTISVKIPGPQTVQKREDNALQRVEFEGLELYLYVRDNQPLVGARATAIREIAEKR